MPEDITGSGIGEPARFAFLITPSDDDELLSVTRGIRIGTAGDVALKTMGNSVIVIPDVLAGETLVIRAVKVYATGTTASGIVGLV